MWWKLYLITALLVHGCDTSVSRDQATRLVIYGNYCGLSNLGGIPVDGVDAICQRHDSCYDRNGYFNCDCDRKMLEELAKSRSLDDNVVLWLTNQFVAGLKSICRSSNVRLQ